MMLSTLLEDVVIEFINGLWGPPIRVFCNCWVCPETTAATEPFILLGVPGMLLIACLAATLCLTKSSMGFSTDIPETFAWFLKLISGKSSSCEGCDSSTTSSFLGSFCWMRGMYLGTPPFTLGTDADVVPKVASFELFYIDLLRWTLCD